VVDDSNSVGVLMQDSSQAANNRLWGFANQFSKFTISAYSDGGSPTNHVTVTRSGNVGIGTTTPAAKLDVVGDIHSSGTVTATSFTGSGAGLSGLTAANISSGTASINITGNAATATNALALGGLAYSAFEQVGNRNAANGYAGLDSSSRLAKAQAPSATVYRDASNTFSAGTQDASVAEATLPIKSVLAASTPTSCVANKELLIKTDAGPGGQQLFVCNGAGNGWNLVGDGASGGVLSFNARTGAVVPAASDYSFSQLSGTLGGTQLSGTYTNAVAFNNASNSFTGNGAGLTNVNAATAATATNALALGGLAATAFEQVANKNAANGYAGLDTGSRIAKAQAPSATVYTDGSNAFSAGTQDLSGAGATLPVKAVLSANTPTSCVANKELLIKTDAGPGGQQLFVCNGTGNGWNLVGDGAVGGVLSFNSRTGVVAPAANDYSFGQIGGVVGGTQLGGTYSNAVAFTNPGNSFVGNGSGLTGVHADTATTATSAATAATAASATEAANALNLGGVAAGNYARLDVGNDFHGRHGMYGNTPDEVLKVDQNGSGAALIAQQLGGDGNAIYARALGNGAAISGVSSGTAGAGVHGVADATSGSTMGVMGRVQSPEGTAGEFENLAGGRIITGRTTDFQESFRVEGNGNVWASGSVTGASFVGDGSGLTGVVATSANHAATADSAAFAANADTLDGVHAAAFAPASHHHEVGEVSGAATLAGNIFVGNQNVEGSVSVSGAVGAGAGIFNGNAANALVQVTQSGDGGGLLATTQGTTNNATAVWGIAFGTTGATNGVHGSTLSPEGAGVWGDAGSSTGNNTGVTGITVSDQGTGVWGQAKADTGSTVGVHGSSWSDLGTGVRGDGPLYGVYGQATSSNGNGVQGMGTATGVFGIGSAENASSIGVVGWSKNHSGIGVSGQVLFQDGASKGVWGVVQSPQGIAGVFDNDSGGKLLSGQVAAVEKFSVDGAGNIWSAGGVQAVSFSGEGSGLSSVHADTATTATTATSATSAATAAEATNALALGGASAGSFARRDGSNSFTGDQSITGNLTLSGSINGGLVVQQTGGATPNVIGGYNGNTVANGVSGATIGGGGAFGHAHSISVSSGTIGGGYSNTVSSEAATVAGGHHNTASGDRATIGGGREHTASGSYATVGGGIGNTASGNSSTVPGGQYNTAQGPYSFAAGRRAKANHDGAFVWGDSADDDVVSTGPNEFRVRATGGAFFSNDLTAGRFLGDGSALSNVTAATASTASGLTCTGCVGNTQLGVNYAASASKGGDALNALLLNGYASSAFQPAGSYATLGANAFTATQTVSSGDVSVGSGNLNLPDTSGSSAGVINLGGSPFIHAYGTGNTFVGTSAGSFTTWGLGGNTAVGYQALMSNTTASWNTASGYQALMSNTTASSNTASGYQALMSNTTGSSNTASGLHALYSNTTGVSNTASGSIALGANTTGLGNTATGYTALYSNTTASWNTASGSQALRSNTTGSSNTASGSYALGRNCYGISSGCTASYNTALGYYAGVTADGVSGNITGANNTFIGAYSGPGTSTDLTNATAIGYQAQVSASNSLVLGGTGSSAVNVGIGTHAPAEKLDVVGNIKASGGVTASSFSGDGSGLSNLPAGTANNLNCTGCVSSSEVDFLYAGSATKGGPATSAVTADTATNALNLGGATATNFARRDVGNAFTGDQGITGNLSVSGSINNALRVDGNVFPPNIIGGSFFNSVTEGVMGATIAGGGGGGPTINNRVTDDLGTVGGGYNNQAGDNGGSTGDMSSATVGGGYSNTASGQHATVSGGMENTASGNGSAVGGGSSNAASGLSATVAGGFQNAASTQFATIGGGHQNTATAPWSSVGGGHHNAASNEGATVGGGDENTASGGYATVPGGQWNTARDYYSFAAGRRAKALHSGAFVWGDSTNADVASTGPDQFVVRASGGAFFSNDLTAGRFLGDGSGLINLPAGTANDLSCVGCVSSSEVDFLWAGSATKGGAATNALALGGLAPSAYAPATGSAAYLAKAGDTMAGTLNLPANGLVAGSNQLVLSGGNVGIGTSSPGAKLDVAGSARINASGGSFVVDNNSIGGTIYQFKNTPGGSGNTSLDLNINNADSQSMTLNFSGGAPPFDRAYIGVDGTPYMRLGRYSNGHRLEFFPSGSGFASETTSVIVSAGSASFNSLRTVGGTSDSTTASLIASNSGGSSLLYVRNDGNVGIGTQTPTEKLDVVGNIKASGGVTATSFSGNGSGLTNVTAGAANDLTCTGCVSSSEVDFLYAGSSTKGGAATSALAANTATTATNALSLGGVAANGYVLKAGDTMAGDLSVPNLTATGSVSGATGSFSGTSTIVLRATKTDLTGEAILGESTATTGFTPGVHGQTYSTEESVGVWGEALATSGPNYGVAGSNRSVSGIGVLGEALATSGSTIGVRGFVQSVGGVAGEFHNYAGGKILRGVAGTGAGTEVFQVDASGNVTAASFSGDGSGLTGVSASVLAAGTYSNALTLSNAGNSFTGNGSGLTNVAAATAATATNALALGGLAPSAYAPATGSAVYLAKAGDTMAGTLNLPANGLVAGSNQLVLSGGNVGIGTASPGERFQVAGGNAQFDDHLLVKKAVCTGANCRTPGGSGASYFVVPGCTGTEYSSNYSNFGTWDAGGLIDLGTTGFVLNDVKSRIQPGYGCITPTVYSGFPVTNVLYRVIRDGANISSGDFVVRGNVGIGTATPAHTLDVVGTGNFSGAVTAASFSGNGAGLTGVSASVLAAGTYSNALMLSNTGNSFTGNGSGLTNVAAATATNALALGGLAPSAYAPATGSAVYLAKAGDTMAGTLNLPADGLVVGSNQLVATGGKVGIGVSGTPAEKLEVNGTVKATGFSGDGSGLTNIQGSQIVNTVNTLQVALLKWYPVNQVTAFAVGTSPTGVAFDGANIWVANAGSTNVTKLRASDGANLGTFAVGINPYGVAFDGANIWVANAGDNTVTKLRASDGAVLGTFDVGNGPHGVAFDGANIWVANNASNNVTKLRASDGENLGNFAVGTYPYAVAFDGANIWVADVNSNNVTKLRASDGGNLGTFAVGTQPVGVAFDGANIWVANHGTNNVTKLRASDGGNLGTFAVGSNPQSVAFDGANIWVANLNSSAVTKLRASDGAVLGTFAVGTYPYGVAFDGANIWVANGGSSTVSKL
jgi:hypothetical protein